MNERHRAVPSVLDRFLVSELEVEFAYLHGYVGRWGSLPGDHREFEVPRLRHRLANVDGAVDFEGGAPRARPVGDGRGTAAAHERPVAGAFGDDFGTVAAADAGVLAAFDPFRIVSAVTPAV